MNNAMDQDAVVTSKFYMLRCLIAMAHADGIVCDEERAYISALMNRLPLTTEQRKAMEHDLENPQAVSELLPYINDPRFRGQLVYFARLMAYKDGNLHPDENVLLERFHTYATDGLDIDTIRVSVKDAVQKEIRLHDIDIDSGRPRKGVHLIPWFQWLDELLLSLGIDLMR